MFQQTGSKYAELSALNSNSGTVIFRLSVNFYTIVINGVRELSQIQCDGRATKMQTVNQWIQVLCNLISTAIPTHSIYPEIPRNKPIFKKEWLIDVKWRASALKLWLVHSCDRRLIDRFDWFTVRIGKNTMQ